MIVSLSWQKRHCEDGLASLPGSGEPLEDYTKFNTSPTIEANKVGITAGVQVLQLDLLEVQGNEYLCLDTKTGLFRLY